MQEYRSEVLLASVATHTLSCRFQLCASVGWGNNEQQYYTDSAHNVAVTELDGLGVLQITAYRESVNGVQPYSSAKLITEGLHAFSPVAEAPGGIRVEARAKMPAGKLSIFFLGTCTRHLFWDACIKVTSKHS